jgi:DNA-binding transcriptional MocR family regulator
LHRPAAAAKHNVDVTPVDRYSQGKVVPDGLQLGFAALDVQEIRRGVRDLAIALEGELKALRCGSQKSLQ